jgi:hypothetical protein
MEQWRQIPEYDYEASSLGRIRNRHKRILKLQRKGDYLCVSLRLNGESKSHLVHRLVAYAFIDFDHALQVNHINGDKHDNRIENLEPVTPSQNVLHAKRVLHKSKLTEQDLIWISFLSRYWSKERIALAFDTTKNAVTSAIRRCERIERERKGAWSDELFALGEN